MRKVVRVAEYIELNIKVVKILIKIGRMPLSTMTDYDIYLFYKSITYESAQMKRYEIVAKNFKCSIDTVRRAVVGMEKVI